MPPAHVVSRFVQEVDVHAVLLAAEESTEAAHQAALPAEAVGLVALGMLLALLFVTHLFRNAGARHKDHSH